MAGDDGDRDLAGCGFGGDLDEGRGVWRIVVRWWRWCYGLWQSEGVEAVFRWCRWWNAVVVRGGTTRGWLKEEVVSDTAGVPSGREGSRGSGGCYGGGGQSRTPARSSAQR
ncbi:proline-rich receptor-like protein kinase PERK9 [Iris pallida]|uniref:Proline-rich receptor-like protein kinase PERK9 n=1 Tax=Iris pallida TaxID=29817 RepID=A0AAX6HG40_IRIPA|nr:proline-rich receptor-like protein kinase PERK9 [Iris pallida]